MSLQGQTQSSDDVSDMSAFPFLGSRLSRSSARERRFQAHRSGGQSAALRCLSATAPVLALGFYDAVPTTLYAARGRLIPFNSNSPTGSTLTAFSTFINTRGLMRI